MRSLSTAIVIAVVVMAGCAKAPPSLSPAGVRIWQANEGVVALGTVQHTAIELNKIQVCDPACHPLVSDRNTGIVVDAVADGLKAIQRVPDGWKATAVVVLERIEGRLDAAGKEKLAAYVIAARTVIDALR